MFNPGERVRIYDNGSNFTATVLYEDDDKLGNTWIYVEPDDTNNPDINEQGQLPLLKKMVTITVI